MNRTFTLIAVSACLALDIALLNNNAKAVADLVFNSLIRREAKTKRERLTTIAVIVALSIVSIYLLYQLVRLATAAHYLLTGVL